MTHNDDFQWTPHPERGGGSTASPGVKGERGGVGDGNTHRGVSFREGGRGLNDPPHSGGGHGACRWGTAGTQSRELRMLDHSD